jgi:hypothetical protein
MNRPVRLRLPQHSNILRELHCGIRIALAFSPFWRTPSSARTRARIRFCPVNHGTRNLTI